MKKSLIGILVLGLVFCFVGCEGDLSDENKYDTNGIEECETNGRCGGCCSHHGGVACRNGVTVCWDGSPLSDTCRQKGCSGCVGCGDLGSCEPYLDDRGGQLYVDIVFEKNYPAENKFYGPAGWVMIDLPPATLTITLRIYPYHITYPDESCWAGAEDLLGLYFEAECDGCDEVVEWVQDSCYYEELRFPFRPYVYFEPIGDGTTGSPGPGEIATPCEEFPNLVCANDETGFVSNWLFFPDEPDWSYGKDEYSYSDINRLIFRSSFPSTATGNTIGYIDMFGLR
jgi:hypothetical protein